MANGYSPWPFVLPKDQFHVVLVLDVSDEGISIRLGRCSHTVIKTISKYNAATIIQVMLPSWNDEKGSDEKI